MVKSCSPTIILWLTSYQYNKAVYKQLHPLSNALITANLETVFCDLNLCIRINH